MFREPNYAEKETNAVAGAEPLCKEKSLKPLRSLTQYLAPHRGHIILGIGAILLGVVSVLLLGQGLKLFVNHRVDSGELEVSLVILSFMIVLLGLSSYGRFYIFSWVSEKVTATLREDLFRHLFTLSPRFFDTHLSADILSRLMSDTVLIQVLVGTSLGVALRNLLLVVGGLIMMVATNPTLTLISLGVIPLILIVVLFYGKYVKKLSISTQENWSSLSQLIQESLRSIRTIFAFNQQVSIQSQFQSLTSRALKSTRQQIQGRSLLTALVIILAFSGVTVVMWVGALDVAQGHGTSGDLTAFLFYALVVAGSMGSFSELAGDLQRTAGACVRLTEWRAETPDLQGPDTLPEGRLQQNQGLVFREAEFSYPTRPDQTILKNFSLEIPLGSHVAIVGPSGVGKSTLFQLLLRFYDPQNGAISLHGIPLSEWPVHHLRDQFSWLSQEPVLMSLSAFDNILIGKPAASEEDVMRAADQAQLLDFLQTLPQGVHTHLGEVSGLISGGQRQRLALARVLLKDSPILLLDEPTSAIDPETEDLIQKALSTWHGKKTILTIAHKPQTIQQADLILVLDKNGISGWGTHADLLKSNSFYSKLMKTVKKDQAA